MIKIVFLLLCCVASKKVMSTLGFDQKLVVSNSTGKILLFKSRSNFRKTNHDVHMTAVSVRIVKPLIQIYLVSYQTADGGCFSCLQASSFH